MSVARTCTRLAEGGARLRYPSSLGKISLHRLSLKAVADVFAIPPSRPSVSPLSLYSRLLHRNGVDSIGHGTQSSHEIAGTAVRVGSKVKGIKVGDRVGVGAQCASCYECNLCKNDNECYCPKQIDTYVCVLLSSNRNKHLPVSRSRVQNILMASGRRADTLLGSSSMNCSASPFPTVSRPQTLALCYAED